MFRQLRKATGLRRPQSHPPDTLEFRQSRVEIRRRSYKRSIGITLQVNGVIKVSAPQSVSLAKIYEFLETHSEWIRVHLSQYEEIRRRYPRKEYIDGESFMLQGEAYTLRIQACVASTPRVSLCERTLLCEIADPTYRKAIAKAIAGYYQREARRALAARVAYWSERMGLYPTGLSFRSQKTRWGSCSTRGRVSLNWRLIVAPVSVIDYVIIHELAHLKYHDHSQAFWSLVTSHCPDHRQLREWLKVHQFEADFLARVSELHPQAHRAD